MTPFTAVRNATALFVKPEYLPADMATLRDPRNIPKADAARLIDFWRDRQEKYGVSKAFRWSVYQREEDGAKTLVAAEYGIRQEEAVAAAASKKRQQRRKPKGKQKKAAAVKKAAAPTDLLEDEGLHQMSPELNEGNTPVWLPPSTALPPILHYGT